MNETIQLQSNIKHQTHIPDLAGGQVLEHGDEVEELVVVGVGEPAADGHGVLRVEDVRGGRVVDYDGLAQVAADLGEVFDVVATVFMGERDLAFFLSGEREGGKVNDGTYA